jgi:chaperonin cofactor prefoldin
MMNDAVQDFRISALERALSSLTGGGVTQHQQPQFQQSPYQQSGQPAVTVSRPVVDTQQDGRIVSLENAVVALSNSVALLNQQMASLSDELQKQSDASNMITITPSTPVDTVQNARLDGIDNLVDTLAQNVADYNKQMSTLIAQYQSMKPRSKAASSANGIKSV